MESTMSGGGQVLQRIESAEAFALFKPGRKASEFDRNLAYADQSLLLFGDFNFDGQQDLAIRNGNDAGYGGPSYDIYLFDPESPTLVLSTSFSALTRDENLGMFDIDPVTKRLHTQSKSGCCWRQSATWQIQDNRPVKVAEKTEVVQKPSEANPFMPSGYVDVTDRELKSGQWTERRRPERPGFGVYCSTKFAVEGLSEAVHAELAPLGINVTIVEPGYFRTEFLEGNSLVESPASIADYDSTAGEVRKIAKAVTLNQPGDPDKLAQAMITLVQAQKAPLRLPLGSDCVAAIEARNAFVAEELQAWRELSVSTDF